MTYYADDFHSEKLYIIHILIFTLYKRIICHKHFNFTLTSRLKNMWHLYSI